MDKYSAKFECKGQLPRFGLLLIVLFLASSGAYAFCAGTLIKEIKAIAASPEVIETVKAANSRQLSKAQIMELDRKWIKLKGRLPEAEQIKGSKVSALLSQEMNRQSYFKEAILTGNQGETVAMNIVTSDYWQGDEEKFTAIFDTNLPSRKPDSHISRARWDDSTKAMIAQVSVPVYDGENMIGTLTVGVDLKRVPHPNH
ncbi:hypothetical protein [Limnobacter sp.]|uniref:hypothetical protein n=1 Tax=Limnobacter sp. TaxID=2003368 RepID=UPI003747C65C